MFIDKRASQIVESDLAGLIAAEVREGKQIEYKLKLDLNNDEHKRKLVRGVASFATASGGDLILGMRAEDGVPKELVPLPGFNADQDILTMRDLIRSNTSPPVSGIEFQPVPLKGGSALLVRVPRSWNGPHMVTYKGEDRFHTRDQAGCVPMSVPEIRAAFTLSETVAERIRRFRVERLSAIRAGETAVNVEPGPKYVIHIFPLRSFEPGQRVSFDALYQKHLPQPLKTAAGHRYTHDLEGFYAYESVKDALPVGYALVFRTGAVEFVQCIIGNALKNRLIPAGFESDLLRAYTCAVEWLHMMDMTTPWVFAVSLFDVDRFTLDFDALHRPMYVRAIRYRDLIIPETVIETPDAGLEAAVRPSCDAVWQACGLERCFKFDKNGKFKPDY